MIYNRKETKNAIYIVGSTKHKPRRRYYFKKVDKITGNVSRDVFEFVEFAYSYCNETLKLDGVRGRFHYT